MLNHKTALTLFAFAAICTFTFVGCEQREKVLDIDTPEGSVEVERSTDSGDISVKVKDD